MPRSRQPLEDQCQLPGPHRDSTRLSRLIWSACIRAWCGPLAEFWNGDVERRLKGQGRVEAKGRNARFAGSEWSVDVETFLTAFKHMSMTPVRSVLRCLGWPGGGRAPGTRRQGGMSWTSRDLVVGSRHRAWESLMWRSCFCIPKV